MNCVINRDNVKRIMKFLKENLDYAILLNKEEAHWLEYFFLNKMDWNEFKKTKIHIKSLDKDELYFTVKKDSNTLDDFVITDNLISTHRTLTLEGILRKLGPTPEFPLEIKFPDSVEYFSKQLEELGITELLRGEELINKEEEENMLKLLEIYKDKKTKEIETKYDKQLEELEANDEAQIFITQAEETLKSILNTETLKINVNSDVVIFTDETWKKRSEIIVTIREEKNKLNTKIKEISALLELAPNYEEKIKILRDYEIVDKKKNIIL